MKQYLLIGGSITLVVLVVLASFTSVVGYYSVQDSKVADSPLFHIRTGSKIKKEIKNSIKCNYIGKDNNFIISLPERNSNKIASTMIVINRIKNMHDDTFNQFIKKLTYEIRSANQVTNEETEALIQTLKYVQGNPEKSLILIKNELRDPPSSTEAFCTLVGHWFPGCLLTVIAAFIYSFFYYIWYFLFGQWDGTYDRLL